MVVVENLRKQFGSQTALQGISFEAGKGRVLGFLGPNGAGKTTTMRILTGFLSPDGGSASVCGLDVQRESLAVRRLIGYLPENNPLYVGMYVKEALGFAADIYKVPQKAKRITEVIGLTGLGPEQHKQIWALSKGYRQRLGLAQAMIHDPEVLILDEPTSGLDPNQLQDIRRLITDLGQYKTIILSTHIMQEVEAVCSDVVIINEGHIVADFAMDNMEDAFGMNSLEKVFTNVTAR